jgi:hypothetical protein
LATSLGLSAKVEKPKPTAVGAGNFLGQSAQGQKDPTLVFEAFR